MPAATDKLVVRFDYWLDPAYDREMAQAADIRSIICRREGDDAHALAQLQQALVYQITGVKDELPLHWYADERLLAACPQLIAVSSNGSGCDTIDIEACTRAGIAVLNQAGGNGDSVAEMTLGLVLNVFRRITESDRALRGRRGFTREDLMGHEVRGRTIGLVGMGEVGRRVASLAAAFGLKVLAHDPLLPDAEIVRRGAVPVGFAELLRTVDIVSLHCPRNPRTLGMVGADQFAAMRPGAVFISTARGGIHDEQALHAALASGHLAGAGLDVWDQEPPPLDHPLLALEQVVASFHTAGVSHEARRNNAHWAALQIIALLRTGERPARLVNPEVWERASARLAAALAPAATAVHG